MTTYENLIPCLRLNKLISLADLDIGDTVELIDNNECPQMAKIMFVEKDNSYYAIMVNYPYSKYSLSSVIKRHY